MTAIPLGPGPEFDRIRHIAAALGDAAGELGDDTAALPAGEGVTVVSTDMSVEDVHFRRAWLTPDEIGWRATASALSDLAAAAATPVGITAAIAMPQHGTEEELVAMMRGVGAAARAVKCKVLGGDLSAGPCWQVTVTVLGRTHRPISRREAKPGDSLWITGTLGGARAALEAWRHGIEPAPAARLAFARPQPRIRAGQWLAREGASAMIDISDGLGGDAGHIAAASGVGIALEIEKVPPHPSVVAVAHLLGLTPAHFAALGGEDYELLVALPGFFNGQHDCEAATGVSLTRIGTVVQGAGLQATLHGEPIALPGYSHTLGPPGR